MKLPAMWKGERVMVVSVKHGKVQIARKCGLRWVKPDEIERSICDQRGADVDRTVEGLKGE